MIGFIKNGDVQKRPSSTLPQMQIQRSQISGMAIIVWCIRSPFEGAQRWRHAWAKSTNYAAFSAMLLQAAKTVLKTFVWFFAFLILLAFTPGLLDIQPTSFRTLTKSLTGPLTTNIKLNSAKKLFSGRVYGPEAFAIHNGQVYTGLHNGWIVKINEENDITEQIVHLGNPDCDSWDEEGCGRPLGLKFGKREADGKEYLYVADCYSGLVKVDVDKGTKRVIFPRTVEVGGKPSLIPNSLDIATNGDIYWSDSSTKWQLKEGLFEYLESAPNGRLLHYDPRKNISRVLVDDLHFANGVQLSSDESFVLVAETWRNRIVKYNLKGPKKGEHEYFIDNLPGGPDNIHENGRGGYWVGICKANNPEKLPVHEHMSDVPKVRKAFARLIELVRGILRIVDQLWPSEHIKIIIYKLAHMSTYAQLDVPYGMVIELDSIGNIVRSLHSPNGQVALISEAAEYNGHLYLGSPWNRYVGKLKLD